MYNTKEKTPVSPDFQNILHDFQESLSLSASSIKMVCGITRTFLLFLDERAIDAVGDIKPEDIDAFLKKMRLITPDSMDSVIYSLRRFFSYLEASGTDIRRIRMLLSAPMRVKKILPTFSEEELSRIIESIDTSASPGKRDFAILSLAITTGMRSSDIISLCLQDIKWKEGEIRKVQQKTGRAVSVILQKPVASAIADYILNERPKSDSKTVFLTARAPHRPFEHGSDLSGVLKNM